MPIAAFIERPVLEKRFIQVRKKRFRKAELRSDRSRRLMEKVNKEEVIWYVMEGKMRSALLSI